MRCICSATRCRRSSADGEAPVEIAGRRFTIGRDLVRDLASQDQAGRIRELRRALLVMHAPGDAIVGIENASKIFAAARHPKSFVSLDTADHLLSRREDAAYAARVLAAWASRYVSSGAAPVMEEAEPGLVVVEETGRGRFQQRITTGRHTLVADEPEGAGGMDSGPGPYDLLLAALGACSAMTVRLYAERKGWPLERVTVRLRHAKIHASDCADCETKGDARIDTIDKRLTLAGPSRRGAARPAGRDRRPLPGAPHAGIRGQDPHRARPRLNDGQSSQSPRLLCQSSIDCSGNSSKQRSPWSILGTTQEGL